MHAAADGKQEVRPASRRRPGLVAVLAVAGLSCALAGCASLTNPVADAVPVRRVPPELLAPSRDDQKTVPLTLLGMSAPATYRLAPGDVLGVSIEKSTGAPILPSQLHVALPLQFRDQRRLPPGAGFPVEIQADGHVTLPFVAPVKVQGLSLVEAEEAIRRRYVDKGLVKPDLDRVLVTMIQQRLTSVLVFRQEAASFTLGAQGVVSTAKRGTGSVIDLPGYENDVLHALAQTGGLPGLDAYNEVIIFRGGFRTPAERALLLQQLESCRDGPDALLGGHCPQVIRIPLRLPPGEPLPIKPEDVVLQSGDVVFLEARDCELFYTGGLLPPGSHILPRDIDLDALQAVVRVGGPLFNGAFGGSNLSGALIQPGIGNPSPSHLVVIRRTPNGGQLPIAVDLRKALRDPTERIRIVPGDFLILQEKPQEALARYFTQTFLNFNLAWEAIHSRHSSGIVDISTPDRLPSRLPTVNIVPRD
jgi:protein involved in polysaccharide export with SLBB domain